MLNSEYVYKILRPKTVKVIWKSFDLCKLNRKYCVHCINKLTWLLRNDNLSYTFLQHLLEYRFKPV